MFAPDHDARWVSNAGYLMVTCMKATPDQPREVRGVSPDGQTVVWHRVLESDEDD